MTTPTTTMRNPTCLLLAFAALTSISYAASPIKGLLGKWTGRYTFRISSSIDRVTVRLEGKRLPNGTIRLTEQQPPFGGLILIHRDFRPDGVFRQLTTYSISSSRSTLVDIKGRWYSKNGKILLSGTDSSRIDGHGTVEFSGGGFRYTWRQHFQKSVEVIKAKR